VKLSAVCRFPSTKRWENTIPPAIGTPAARYEGHERGKPIFTIEDLTYLPKLLRASPRKTTSASSGSTPTTPSRLFKGKKRSGDSSEGPSTPSLKRIVLIEMYLSRWSQHPRLLLSRNQLSPLRLLMHLRVLLPRPRGVRLSAAQWLEFVL